MMTESQIDNYVRDLLTVSGFHGEGEERRVWTLLHHLYCAVAMWELASQEERDIVDAMRKKLQYFFAAKIKLKETKRKTKETENLPPTPPIKEKESPKEKTEKTPPCVERIKDVVDEKKKEAFRQECLAFVGKYDNARLADFFNYWSEETSTTGRMRFEGQRYWNLEKRLARWMNHSYSSDDTAAAIRLCKTKKRLAEETAAARKQQQVAAEVRQMQQQAAEEREKQQRALEQQVADSKRDSITTAEYTARNPNGFLARLERERNQKEGLRNNGNTE